MKSLQRPIDTGRLDFLDRPPEEIREIMADKQRIADTRKQAAEALPDLSSRPNTEPLPDASPAP